MKKKKKQTLMVVSEEAEYKSEVFSSKARDHTVYLCPIKVQIKLESCKFHI